MQVGDGAMSKATSPAVVLLSGGMDSAVLLHTVAADGRHGPLHALSFEYGQRHGRELACARWQAKAAGAATHRVIDASFLGDLLRGATTLMSGGPEVPDLDDVESADLDQPSTYVPNRNMMFLSLAAAYAEAHGIRDVFYGAHAQDEYGYWDCTAEFVAQINRVLELNRRQSVTVHAPFIHLGKKDLVRRGLKLGVDFAHTWSCYRGGERACGRCPTCVERLNAFRTAGVPDPLPYVDKGPSG